MRRKKLIWIIPAAILGMALFAFIGGEVVKLLWNWLLPPLFSWRQIAFWQGLGILVLCRILFGGFGGHHSYRSNFRRRVADRMADRMADRWGHMTPEERERFRQKIRERWGFDPVTGEGNAH